MKATDSYAAQRRADGQGAFTLVDLMIALSIITLLGAIAIPGIRRKLPEKRLEGAVAAAVSQLRTARVRARSEARPVVVEIDCAQQLLTFKSDRNDNALYEGSEIAVQDLTMYRGVEMASTATSAVFTARGEFYCSTVALKLSLTAGSAGSAYVYVFPGGLVEESRRELF